MRQWQEAEDGRPRLQFDRMTAVVDPAQPSAGWQEVVIDGQPMPDLHPLGPELTPIDGAATEFYLRGGDLVATYNEQPAAEMRSQVYWRAASHLQEAAIAAVELVVSVQTSLLDSCPGISIASHLLASEALRMTDAERGTLVNIVPPSADADPDSLPGAPHCYLFRLPDQQYSYIEMIHPADVQTSNWDGWLHGAHYRLQLRHALFADRLEKGVILRARVLGVVVDRRDDKLAAARHWTAFLNEKLPLTA